MHLSWVKYCCEDPDMGTVSCNFFVSYWMEIEFMDPSNRSSELDTCITVHVFDVHRPTRVNWI